MPEMDLLAEMRLSESTRLKSNWLEMDIDELFFDQIEEEKQPRSDPFKNDLEMFPQRMMGFIPCVYGMFDDPDGGLSEYHLCEILAPAFGYEDDEEWAARVFGEDNINPPVREKSDSCAIICYSNGTAVTCNHDELAQYINGNVEQLFSRHVTSVSSFDLHEETTLHDLGSAGDESGCSMKHDCLHPLESNIPKKKEISRWGRSHNFKPKTKLNAGDVVRKMKRVASHSKQCDYGDEYEFYLEFSTEA